MGKRKYVTNLYNYLETKLNSVNEEINVDVVPLNDKNILDGASVIIALGNSQINYVIKPEFINEELTTKVRQVTKDINHIAIDGNKATEFLNDIKKTMLSKEETRNQIKQLIKDPEVNLDDEELFYVTDISGKIGIILIDKSVELEITQKAEIQGGRRIYLLKLTKNRIDLSKKAYDKITKKPTTV